MAKTTVNSGFWSGGTQELTPLDGSTNHGARLRKVEVPEPHVEPAVEEHVEPEPVPVKPVRKPRAKKTA